MLQMSKPPQSTKPHHIRHTLYSTQKTTNRFLSFSDTSARIHLTIIRSVLSNCSGKYELEWYYSRSSVIQSDSEPLGVTVVIDRIVLAVVVIHEGVNDSEIEQVIIQLVDLVGLHRLPHLVAVGSIVEDNGLPPENRDKF